MLGPQRRVPEVDVVIPVLDGLPFVVDAVRSVVEQAGVVARAIVVDDGSSDGTPEAVRALGLPRVTVLSGYGRESTPAARNRGIAEATAPWLCFLDADDLWPRGRTRALLDAIADPARELAMGYLRPFASDPVDPDPVDLDVRHESIAGLEPAACAGGVLSSREVVERVGGFDAAMRVGEFVDWLARARSLGIAEVIVPTVALLRRAHAGNTSRARREAYAADVAALVARHRLRTRAPGDQQ